jgi:hypothetical protein
MKRESCGKTTATIDRLVSDMVGLMASQTELISGVVTALAQRTGQFVRTALQEATAQKTSTCCDIPEPCWMPLEIGEVVCRLCPGGRGVVRLRITNTDFRQRSYNIVATGPDAGRISFDVGTFVLDPKVRRTVTATFDAASDDGDKCHKELEALVWVLGCRYNYLRWAIHVGHHEEPCCREFEVQDGPDYVLHWYDHFYCPRPCFGPSTIPGPQPAPEG